MASFADGFGDAFSGLLRLAGCAVVIGFVGVVIGAAAVVWALSK